MLTQSLLKHSTINGTSYHSINQPLVPADTDPDLQELAKCIAELRKEQCSRHLPAVFLLCLTLGSLVLIATGATHGALTKDHTERGATASFASGICLLFLSILGCMRESCQKPDESINSDTRTIANRLKIQLDEKGIPYSRLGVLNALLEKQTELQNQVPLENVVVSSEASGPTVR